jgi:hypothetical protein
MHRHLLPIRNSSPASRRLVPLPLDLHDQESQPPVSGCTKVERFGYPARTHGHDECSVGYRR